MSERAPRQPIAPATPRADRTHLIIEAAAVEDPTAAAITGAYLDALGSEATWPDRLAARAPLDTALDEIGSIESKKDIPEIAGAVDRARDLLERVAALARDADVTAAVRRITTALEELRAELGQGRYDRAKWWPADDFSPLFERDLETALVRSLRWYHVARRVAPKDEPRVAVVLRCSISTGFCTDDHCDHPGCARPGDVATVAISEAKVLCELVTCTSCDGGGTEPAAGASSPSPPSCGRCAGTGRVPQGAEPYDDEARRALANWPDMSTGRRGRHSDAAVQAALLAGKRQRLLSRTTPGQPAADANDTRIRCSEASLPAVVAAVLHRAGLGSEWRTKSLEALTKRVKKVYRERLEVLRTIDAANALRVIRRRTK